MQKTSARVLILFLTVQILALAALIVSSCHVIMLSHKITQKDNISTLRDLTASYAQTVSSINANYTASRDVIPGIRNALTEIKETLDKLSKAKIRITKKIVFKPLGNSSAIKKSQKALDETITVLASYETKTQPAMVKSLQETEKTLQKISEQLNEEQQEIQHFPWYIAAILVTIAVIMLTNTLFLVYMYKRPQITV